MVEFRSHLIDSFVESRCCCRRFESVGPTVTNMKQRTTEHHSAAGRAMSVDHTANMSWKALDWATESDIRSPTTKFVLHLLANKADEDFSCYPSIHTLMTESGAGRSTVMRALQELEATGFITRSPQFHDSGAQRSTRYYLNHPQAPHLAPRPDLGPRTGVPNRDPLNPPLEPPSDATPGCSPLYRIPGGLAGRMPKS